MNVMASDPLSKFFRVFGFSNLVCGESIFSPPWGVTVPPGKLSFYAVRSGNCQLTFNDSSVIHHIRGGDFVILTDGKQHALYDELSSDIIPLPIETLARKPSVANIPPSTDPCMLVYGQASLEPFVGNLFKQSLPSTIQVHRGNSEHLKMAEPLLAMISDECQTAASGFQSVVQQLVQLLLIQTIRSYLLDKSGLCANGKMLQEPSVLYAAADPNLGPILDVVSSSPGDPWTVVGLAKRARMSKSAFSERFRKVVGVSPMQYVTELRLQKACEMLSGTEIGIKQIAKLVGYESASSFSNAFRRKLGISPIDYRKTSHALG